MDHSSTLTSASSSGLDSPDTGEKKHIHFDELVEQCIALEVKSEDDEEREPYSVHDDHDNGRDSGAVMMKRSNSRRKLPPMHKKPAPQTNSFTAESRTVAMLPSTTLKY